MLRSAGQRAGEKPDVVVELQDLSPRGPQYKRPRSGIRAKIQARRDKLNEQQNERRAGDGVGGGAMNYFRILKYGKPLDFILMSIGAITALATGVAYPVMVIVFGSFVDHFFQYAAGGDLETFTWETSSLCLKFVYIFLAKWGMGFISMACFRLSAIRISSTLRLSYITAIFRQDLAYFDVQALTPVPILENTTNQLSTDHTNPAVHKPGTPGSVAISITTVSSIVQMGIGERIGSLCQSLTMLIAGFTIALQANWELTCVTSAIVPVAIIFYCFTVPIQVKIDKRIIMAHAKAADLAEEILSTIRTVKSFNSEKAHAAKYDTLLERAKTEGIRKSPLTGTQFLIGIFIIFSAYAICFWYGIILFRDGDIKSPGEILIVFFAALFGIGSFAALPVPIQAMAKASAASSIIFQVIDRFPLVDSLSTEGLEPTELPAGDIELRNLRFAYPGGGNRERLIVLGKKQRSPFANPSTPSGSPYIEDDQESYDQGGLTLNFPRNKTTAIVGPSGAGKSTIVALLERWYEPQEGSIMIGDTDIAQFNLRYWRGKIGLVMQEPFLFNDSIFKNISYGLMGTIYENISEAGKRQMVHEACAEANAAEFIDELPDKYDSIVGQGGINLSGGQKQRIAIARSIISKPSILILDEATSALDPINEQLIHQSLGTVSKGRTTIIIAHRLSTVKNADKIVVLDEGNIVETGNHAELISRPGGAYKQLVEAQSLMMGVADEDSFICQDLREISASTRLNTLRDRRVVPDEEEALASRYKWKNIGIFKLIWMVLSEQRKLWPIYISGLVGSLGSGIAFPMSALLFASFIITFELARIGEMELFFKTGSFWALMFLVLGVGSGLMSLLMGWMLTKSSCISGTHYRSEYFRNVLAQRIPYFDKVENSPGELTSRLNIYPSAIQECIGSPAGLAVAGISTLIASCCISLYICPKLSGIIILACVPLNLASGFVKVRIEQRFVKDALAVFEESSQFATEAVGAYRTVSSLRLERPIRDRFKTLLQGHVKKQSRRILWSSVFYSAVESMAILASAFTFWCGGILIAKGEIGVFEFYVVYMTILQGSEAVGSIFGSAHGIALAVISANRMFSTRTQVPRPYGRSMNSETGGCAIEFKEVDFKYPNRNFKVFGGLSLKIEKGQFVAFVGPSGCGKTTTISLLERFYEVNKGEILIDGQCLASLNVEGYRSVVSLVAQEPTLYQGTIRENICIGATEDVTEEDIIQASRDAYLHDFVMSLPDGYNTICGIRGIGLSGGQKQRLSIARALIRKPRILLLDEATASLDSESERIVQKALEKITEGRKMTVIAVAHRISSIQNADMIFVFNSGKVVERGSHEALVHKRGMYFQMCQAQALDR